MPHDEACEARLKFILPPPTDEELATMMELKAEKAKLLKTRSAYTCLINYLHNEFQQIYKEDFNLCQENDNLRVELVKIAHEFGFQIPEEKEWKQPTSTRTGESIEDFCLRMLEATGSQGIRSDDLPPGFPTVIPYCDSQPHMGAAAFDFDHDRADADSFFSLCGTQPTATNSAVCGSPTSRTTSQVEALGANTSMGGSSEKPFYASPKINEPSLPTHDQQQKEDQRNSIPQRNQVVIPIHQPATTAATTEAVHTKALPKVSTRPRMECMAGPKAESSLMSTSVQPWNSCRCEDIQVQKHLEVCEVPWQHSKPVDSCKAVSMASPLQNQAMHSKITTESQGESLSAVQEHQHSHSSLETAATLPQSLPWSSSGSSIGGPTTFVVRNIPSRYTKEMLLQEWSVDGTFDFFYLPFSFKLRKTAGYAFLNFTSVEAASAFRTRWHGVSLSAQVSSAKLSICAAEAQGLEANVRHLLKNKIARVKNPMYLPSVFDGLQEIPFSECVQRLEQSHQNASAEQHVQLQ